MEFLKKFLISLSILSVSFASFGMRRNYYDYRRNRDENQGRFGRHNEHNGYTNERNRHNTQRNDPYRRLDNRYYNDAPRNQGYQHRRDDRLVDVPYRQPNTLQQNRVELPVVVPRDVNRNHGQRPAITSQMVQQRTQMGMPNNNQNQQNKPQQQRSSVQFSISDVVHVDDSSEDPIEKIKKVIEDVVGTGDVQKLEENKMLFLNNRTLLPEIKFEVRDNQRQIVFKGGILGYVINFNSMEQDLKVTIIKTIMQYVGYDISVKDKLLNNQFERGHQRCTPITLAAKEDYYKLLRYLVGVGLSLLAQNEGSHTFKNFLDYVYEVDPGVISKIFDALKEKLSKIKDENFKKAVNDLMNADEKTSNNQGNQKSATVLQKAIDKRNFAFALRLIKFHHENGLQIKEEEILLHRFIGAAGHCLKPLQMGGRLQSDQYKFKDDQSAKELIQYLAKNASCKKFINYPDPHDKERTPLLQLTRNIKGSMIHDSQNDIRPGSKNPRRLDFDEADEIIKILLKNGAKIDRQGGSGKPRNPLQWAAYNVAESAEQDRNMISQKKEDLKQAGFTLLKSLIKYANKDSGLKEALINQSAFLSIVCTKDTEFIKAAIQEVHVSQFCYYCEKVFDDVYLIDQLFYFFFLRKKSLQISEHFNLSVCQEIKKYLKDKKAKKYAVQELRVLDDSKNVGSLEQSLPVVVPQPDGDFEDNNMEMALPGAGGFEFNGQDETTTGKKRKRGNEQSLEREQNKRQKTEDNKSSEEDKPKDRPRIIRDRYPGSPLPQFPQ